MTDCYGCGRHATAHVLAHDGVEEYCRACLRAHWHPATPTHRGSPDDCYACHQLATTVSTQQAPGKHHHEEAR